MTPELRSLMMRANRLLGGALVEHNLVKIDDLEKANERLLELVGSNQPRQSTVLGILAYEFKVLSEEDILQHLVEAEGLGLVDLHSYDPPDDAKKDLDLGVCWATWSVPFDCEEEFTYIATAYYMSPAVRTFWEKRCAGPVIWFGTTLENIADYLEGQVTKPAGSTSAPFPVGQKTAPGAPAATAAPAPKAAAQPPVAAKPATNPPVAAKPATRPPVDVKPATNPAVAATPAPAIFKS